MKQKERFDEKPKQEHICKAKSKNRTNKNDKNVLNALYY